MSLRVKGHEKLPICHSRPTHSHYTLQNQIELEHQRRYIIISAPRVIRSGHFRTLPRFWLHLPPLRISWWCLKRFMNYRIDKQTNKVTNWHDWKQYYLVRYVIAVCLLTGCAGHSKPRPAMWGCGLWTIGTNIMTQGLSSINQSINQRNFYSAPYKTWTAALDNVNI